MCEILKSGLNHFIRHEAGHVLLYWLLDRPLAGCVVTDKAGLTHPIRTEDTRELIMPHILVALAGMVMASEYEVIDELEGNLHEPGYFHDKTDARIVAEAMQSFDPAQRLPLLFQFRLLLSRLKRRFAKVYAEIRRLLSQPPHQLLFIELNQLFQKWDLANGFDKRPKSDVVMRMYRRIARQPLPKGQWLGWDSQIISKWKFQPTGLKETVRLAVREQMQDAAPGNNGIGYKDCLTKDYNLPYGTFVPANPHANTFNAVYFDGHAANYKAPATPFIDIYHNSTQLKDAIFLYPLVD